MDKRKSGSSGEECPKQNNSVRKYTYKPLPSDVLRNTRLLGNSFDEYIITTELDRLLCESLSRVLGIHKAYEIIENIKRLTGMSPAEVLVNNPRDFIKAFERAITSPPERILHEVFRVLSFMVGVNEDPPDVINIGEFMHLIEKIIKTIADTKARYFSRIINGGIGSK